MAKEFLLKVARAKIEAYTASITWDEIAWILRKLFGAEASVDMHAMHACCMQRLGRTFYDKSQTLL